MRITRTDSTPTPTPTGKVTTRLAEVSEQDNQANQDWRKVAEEVADHAGPRRNRADRLSRCPSKNWRELTWSRLQPPLEQRVWDMRTV